VGPRASLNGVKKRKYYYPYRESNSGRPARSQVTILTELPQLMSIYIVWIKRNTFVAFIRS
jgi:hypothetical protein